MGFNHPARNHDLSSIYEAPLAYGVNYDWGTLSVTDQADAVYGLTPQAEVGHEFQTFADRTRRPYPTPIDPSVHILLASQSEFADGPLEMGRTAVQGVPQPKAIHIILASGTERDNLDLSLGFELTELAEEHNVEDIPLSDRFGRPISRDEIVVSRMVSSLASAAMSSTVDLWPIWQRNHQSEIFLRTLKLAGLGGVVLASVADTAEIVYGGSPGPTHFITPIGILLVTGGVLYTHTRQMLSGATGREFMWRNQANNVGSAVGRSIARTYVVPPADEASPEDYLQQN